MPLVIESFVTLSDVRAQIARMEAVHGITSGEFERNCTPDHGLNEDAALEWSFLIEQERALASLAGSPERAVKRHVYSRPSVPGQKLQAVDTVAAQEKLAA